MTLAGGLLLSLLSAAALNWGWIAQHGAARDLPALRLREPLRSLRSLFADLSWLAGFVVGIIGWALYVAALALAPLSLVQAVSAGGIALLAAFAHRRGDVLTRVQLGGVVVATVGLVLLAASLAGGATDGRAPNAADAAVWLIVLVGLAALASSSELRLVAGASLGVAAGILYGTGDIATKAATFGGAWLVLAAVVLAAHGAAFVALQFGFQRGGALATAGTATLLTNALPILAGVLLFHERLPGGALGALRIVAFALVVAAAASLAREERDGLSGQTLAAAREAEMVGRCGADVHLRATERIG
jgi:drug/metabolite transporter (DMT)-like permease